LLFVHHRADLLTIQLKFSKHRSILSRNPPG
jgi:hypothetical protein